MNDLGEDSNLVHVGKEEELAFWAGFVNSPRFVNNWLKASPNPELDIEVDLMVRAMSRAATPDAPVQVLDVGSGPVSHFSNGFDRTLVRIHAADPLGDDYDRLWNHELKASVCTPVACAGEKLTSHFKCDFFDLVHIRNAIDHVVNPIQVLSEALKIIKPDGYVMVHGWEDEAKHQNYRGMHQWSMKLSKSPPDLLFLDKDDRTLSVRTELGPGVTFQRIWNKYKPKKAGIWSGALMGRG